MAKKSLTPIARTLRTQRTDAEILLWSKLRSRQLENAKFRQQAPIGNAVADFLCHEIKLIIELDGSQHGENPGDAERSRILEASGFSVLRYWNNEIFENLDGVLEDIRQAIRSARNQ
ncbi:endonuclease domain-containing protein [Parasphingorhabdus sp.]|uniref:endonuclease domain-containing protein n=1 Tax=Parasphingorhabdus sp. TaxID=2709688 RepID=UPI003BAE5224